MNKMEIFVLVVVGGSLLLGYRKGIIKMAFQLVSGLIATLMAFILTPMLVKILSASTTIDENLYKYIDHSFKWNELFSGMDLNKINPDQILPNMGIPKLIQDIVVKQLAQKAESALTSDAFRDAINSILSQVLMYAGGFFITLILSFIVLRIVLSVLEIAAKLPVIKQLNHLGGGAIGLVFGVLIVWIAFAIIQLGIGNEIYSKMVLDIQQSSVVKILYENNLVMKLLLTMVKL